MSKEQIEKFLDQLNSNVELQEELKSAPTAAAVADIAKNLGFDVTTGDVLRSQATATTKLSGSELENISGGGLFFDVAKVTIVFWGFGGLAAGGLAYGVNEMNKD